ncbi:MULTISPECIES: 30S ribosomal protein S6 [Aminobacterium]|uniref:Small ribosomal subunit protein bS6 n=1 Tax=Aminobacterium colombiense (strain DSM 12261 / ALA-1) TaxID=572547 RepID=D5EG57_AMICL|nr:MULTISPECIES: 30S ribosomal protein S6 [Aminobacterium]MDD2378943.1 30S ribosomal protein S6 [Aminobacterium colombiense]ADE57539.1 ribosomal protein S6 [Aminobacterium colombiense DSM 12261]MDD3768831.1 30S ribosomal protein S6 [Aminobacterium colombiense]MDD4265142.1 30S ribosomal protein S6 [Aminobacterium colombiense]MDD4585677.1 30S ribosomal protein S6 [Aminobacterium colombiense]
MRPYEMMILVNADLEEPKEEVSKVEEVVRSLGGELSKTDIWGKRKLAYPVNEHTDGFYAVMTFKLNPDEITELERLLSLRQNVHRQMIVRLDEE